MGFVAADTFNPEDFNFCLQKRSPQKTTQNQQ
jgi:hypothetical protein